MGVLPLFGLLKGLLFLFFVVIIKAFSLLFTHAARACVRAEHRAVGLGLPPVRQATVPSEGTRVLRYTRIVGERAKQKKSGENKKRWIINSLTSCCSGPRGRSRAPSSRPSQTLRQSLACQS